LHEARKEENEKLNETQSSLQNEITSLSLKLKDSEVMVVVLPTFSTSLYDLCVSSSCYFVLFSCFRRLSSFCFSLCFSLCFSSLRNKSLIFKILLNQDKYPLKKKQRKLIIWLLLMKHN
jgi:hypothetical protein